MNKQEVKTLVDCIREVESRVPITSRFGDQVIFRGEHFTISDDDAQGERNYFTFSDPGSFLKGLVRHGLLLNPMEQNRVLKLYYKKVQAG